MPLTVPEQLGELNARVGKLEAALKRIEAALTPVAPQPPKPVEPPRWAAPQGRQDTGSHANPNDAYLDAVKVKAVPRKAGPWKDPHGILRDENGEIIAAKPAETPRGPDATRQPGFVDEVIDRMTPLTVDGGR